MAGKNVVLCSDGTGNAGGKGRGTNVWRTFLAVDQHGHENGSTLKEQIAFYDDGVGTSTARWKALPGKAFGVGLSRNIRELYTSLARNFEDGDQIYLFGFSRGAFTIRSLAGMIAEIGVIDPSKLDRSEGGLADVVGRAYGAYRKRGGDGPRQFKEECARKNIPVHRPNIQFLGVWDTVSAIGVPFAELRRGVQAAAFMRRPHCHDLNSKLVQVRHALALDEARRSFKLEMFNERLPEEAKSRGESWSLESVEQVWFAGVHSNVGGGYPKKGMESVSLYWMMVEAEKAGLRLDPESMDRAGLRANVHSKLYDSRGGVGVYYRFRAREVNELCAEGGTEPKIHVTAVDRIRRVTEGYAPINLPPNVTIVGTERPVAAGGAQSQEALAGEQPTPSAGESSAADPEADLEAAGAQEALGPDFAYTDTGLLTKAQAVRGGVGERPSAVKTFSRQILASGKELEQLIKDGRALNRSREILYYAFFALSAVLLVILLGQEAAKHGIAGADDVVGFFVGLSDQIPLLGWTEPALAAVAQGAKLVLPELLAEPVAGLARVSELIIVIAIVAWLLFRFRRGLVRRARSLGYEAWGKVMSKP